MLFAAAAAAAARRATTMQLPENGERQIPSALLPLLLYTEGSLAQVANIHTRTVANYADGTFSIAELTEKIRPSWYSVHTPRSALICLENTHNQCSGAVVPLDFIDDVSQATEAGGDLTGGLQVSRVARSNNLMLHLDGARVFNAAVALDVPVHQVVDRFDTVSVCLSKVCVSRLCPLRLPHDSLSPQGLGCPAGNVVAGSKDFMEKAIRCRKLLGGSMRQSGVLAATGIVALNTMVERLAEDHKHARMMAEGE